MKPIRMNKVNELLRTEIADIILKKLKDPRLSRWISVTEVITSKDLQHARVFFSTAGDDLMTSPVSVERREERHREITDVLNGAGDMIRQELRERVRIKFIPALRFEYDETLEYGLKLDRLIEKANRGDSE